jgi:hypothetical protein
MWLVDDEVVTRWNVSIYITFISSIWHPWLMTKWCWCPIIITMVNNWLQVIWYERKQAYPPTYLPTHIPTYLPTHSPNNRPTCLFTHQTTYLPPICHQPTYLLPTHTPTCLPPIYPPTHSPTHPFTYPFIHLLTSSTYLLTYLPPLISYFW